MGDDKNLWEACPNHNFDHCLLLDNLKKQQESTYPDLIHASYPKRVLPIDPNSTPMVPYLPDLSVPGYGISLPPVLVCPGNAELFGVQV